MGQNAGFAKGNEEKTELFGISLHQICAELLSPKHHCRQWGSVSKTQDPLLVELALWLEEVMISTVTEYVGWCVRRCSVQGESVRRARGVGQEHREVGVTSLRK